MFETLTKNLGYLLVRFAWSVASVGCEGMFLCIFCTGCDVETQQEVGLHYQRFTRWNCRHRSTR